MHYITFRYNVMAKGNHLVPGGTEVETQGATHEQDASPCLHASSLVPPHHPLLLGSLRSLSLRLGIIA